jgi:hypothetical protein
MRIAMILLLLATSAVAQMRGMAAGRGGFGGGRGFHGPGPGFSHGARFGGGFHGPGIVFRGNGFGRGIPFPGSFSGQPFFHGVPASVTSLGPCGFTPCFKSFGFGRFGFRRFGFSPFFGGGFWGGYPIVAYDDSYSSAYYPSGYADEPEPMVQQPMIQQPAIPQQLEITIVDKRHEPKDNDPDPLVPGDDSPNVDKLPDPDPPADPMIFIFRDGSRKDLRNFAIMRGQLVDLSDGKIFRIPLEKIDWDKTLAVNAEAGHEIKQVWLK